MVQKERSSRKASGPWIALSPFYTERRKHPSRLRPTPLRPLPRTDRLNIVVIALRLLHEVERVFMDVAETIPARIHATFELVPDDAVAKYPVLIVGELKGDPPGDTDQPLVVVTVPYVEPNRTGAFEYPPNFFEYGTKVFDILTAFTLQTDATIIVLPHPPIWWRGHNEVHGLGRQFRKHVFRFAA